jgi:hypothetical protein
MRESSRGGTTRVKRMPPTYAIVLGSALYEFSKRVVVHGGDGTALGG